MRGKVAAGAEHVLIEHFSQFVVLSHAEPGRSPVERTKSAAMRVESRPVLVAPQSLGVGRQKRRRVSCNALKGILPIILSFYVIRIYLIK